MAWMLLWVGLLVFFLCSLLLVACHDARLFQISTQPDVSVLLIVRDQALIIEGLMKGLLSYCQTSPFSWELVVVVDVSSRDETSEILQRLQRKHSFKLVPAGTGEDPLKTGLSACRGSTAYYVRLTGKVHLQAAVAIVRCLTGGERIPEFGVYRPCEVIPGTPVR